MNLPDLPWYTIATYVLPFVAITALALAIKGLAAVRWSDGVLKSVRTNLALSLINAAIAPVAFWLTGYLQAGYDAIGLWSVSRETWDGLPFVAALLAFILVYDFCDYWAHRLLHTGGFWPIHAVHHSDTDMNWTTTYRIHILEIVVMRAFYVAFGSWLGLSGEVIAAALLLTTLWNAFVHADLDIHFGPLTRVISTPRFHRWHHADTPEAYNTNFGNVFSFWDVLFGTYHVPGPYRGALGYEGTPGHDLSRLLALPVIGWVDAARARSDQDGDTGFDVLPSCLAEANYGRGQA